MKKFKKLSEVSSHYYVWVVFVVIAVLCGWTGYYLCSIDNGAKITPTSIRVHEQVVPVTVKGNHFHYGRIEGTLNDSICTFLLEEEKQSHESFSRNVVKELVYSKTTNQFVERTTTFERSFKLEKERNGKMWKSVWGKVVGIALFTISIIFFGLFIITVYIWYDEFVYYRSI